MRRVVASLAVVVLVAGCAPAPVSGPATAPAASDPALVAARTAAGIPDCPVTDATAPARADGLPAVVLGCLGSERTVNLAGLRGRPLVVNLWAQWCLPCRQESAYLREGAARLGDRVLFLGVNYDDPQPDWAIEFAGLAGWTYPHAVDPTRTLAGPLRVQGIPTTIFVDAEGVVVHRHSGPFASTAELEGLVATHLGVAT